MIEPHRPVPRLILRTLCACAAGFSAIAVGSVGDLSVAPLARSDATTAAWAQRPFGEARRVMLIAAKPRHRGTTPAADAVRRVGGRVLWASEAGVRIDAELTPAQAAALARDPAIESYELWTAPSTDGPVEREVSGAVVLENELGLTGAGVVGGISDRGLFDVHVEFSGRPPVFQTDNSDALSHGTAAYGVLFAAGDAEEMARGMLPDATGVFASYDNFDDRDAVIADLFGPDTRGVFQSNSWGGARTRIYSTASVELDEIVARRDALIIQSQSNTGDQDSRPEAWAKNVVSIGGVNGEGTVGFGDDTWARGASSGPSLDGRVKPDLVHFNSGVLTTDDDGPQAYRTFTGTSAAAPLAAGVFGLFHELWATGELGNPISGGDAWAERPSSALARALIINIASRYPFTSAADDFGRFRQGWGVPDVGALWRARDRLSWFDRPQPLREGEAATFELAADGLTGLNVTLVYVDPPAEAFATRTTVNDLDLIVESPGGVVYRGNVGLFEGNESRPGGEPDRANTVENVFVPAGPAVAGSWTVRVVASRVAVDADPATPERDQNFAVAVTGAVGVTDAAPAMYLADPPEVRGDQPWEARVGLTGDAPITSGRVLLRRGGGPTLVLPVDAGPDGDLAAAMPPVSCRGVTEIAIEALEGSSVVARWPRGGGYALVRPAHDVVAVDERFDSPAGWSAATLPDRGAWEWAVPSGGGVRNDPPFDADGDGAAWVTEDGPGLRDVADAPAVLESPDYDLSDLPAPRLSYDAWLACDDAGDGTPAGVVAAQEDVMVVSASSNGGATWTEIDVVRSTFRWSRRTVRLDGFGGASSVRLRFEIADAGSNSMTEAGIDRVRIDSPACAPCDADIDGSGSFDLADTDGFITLFVERSAGVDFDRSGTVDLLDIDRFIVSALDGCPN